MIEFDRFDLPGQRLAEARLVLVEPLSEVRLVFGQARVEPLRAGSHDRVDRLDLAGQRLAEARLVLVEPLSEVRLVFGQARVEPLRAVGHDRIDRLDLPGQRLAEARRVRAQPPDHAVAGFADQRIQGAELLVDAPRLIGEVGHQGAAAGAEGVFEVGDGRGERVVHALAADRNRRHRFAGDGSELLADFARLVAPALERDPRRLLHALLHRGRLVGDRLGGALRRNVDLPSDRFGGIVDEGPQLGVAGVEMLVPGGPGGFEQRPRVLGLVGHRRFEAGVGGGERFLQRLAAHHHRLVQAIGDRVESRGELAAMRDDRLGDAAGAVFDPADEVVDALAEFARHRFADHRQACRHRVAVQANRVGGLGAALGDVGDHYAVVVVERPAGQFGGGGQLGDDRFGVAVQRIDGQRASRLEAGDQLLIATGEIGRQRLAGAADALIDVGDAADDLFGAAPARRGQAGGAGGAGGKKARYADIADGVTAKGSK